MRPTSPTTRCIAGASLAIGLVVAVALWGLPGAGRAPEAPVGATAAVDAPLPTSRLTAVPRADPVAGGLWPGRVLRDGRPVAVAVRGWDLGRPDPTTYDLATRRNEARGHFGIGESPSGDDWWWLTPGLADRLERALAGRDPPTVLGTSEASGEFALASPRTDGFALLLARAEDGATGFAIARPEEDGTYAPALLLLPGSVASLEGRVLRSDGSPYVGPVHHASVARSEDGERAPRFAVSTAADGRFRIEGLAVGVHAVEVRAEGGAAVTVFVPHGGPLELRLESEAAGIPGRARQRDGTPVPGARVVPGGPARIVGVTDADGRFRVPRPGGRSTLQVEGEDFEGVFAAYGPTSQEIEVVVTKRERVRARVVDARTGAPVSGVPVSAGEPPTNSYGLAPWGIGVSGPGGLVELHIEREDRIRLIAYGNGWMNEGLDEVGAEGFDPYLRPRPAAGSDEIFELRVVPSPRLVGQVLDPDGAPVPDATLDLEQVGRIDGHHGERFPPMVPFLPDPAPVRTDAEGGFTFPTVRPWLLHRLWVWSPSKGSSWSRLLLDGGAETRIVVRLEAHAATSPQSAGADSAVPGRGASAESATLVVRLRGADGSVPRNALLSAYQRKRWSWGPGVIGGRRSDGAFVLGGLAPGAWQLNASGDSPTGPQEASLETEVALGETEKVLELAPAPQAEPGAKDANASPYLRVRVVDPTGAPVVEGTIERLEPAPEGNQFHFAEQFREGEVSMLRPRGAFRLMAFGGHGALSGAAWGPVTSPEFGDAAEVPEGLTLTMTPGRTVEGHVVVEGGAAVPGVRVDAYPLTGYHRIFRGQPHATARSDPSGDFRLEGLGVEAYRLVVHGPPSTRDAGTTVVEAAESRVAITLLRALSVIVTVLDADGRPLVGADVGALEEQVTCLSHVGNDEPRTGPTGRARLEGLESARTYVLAVDPPGAVVLAKARIRGWHPSDTTVRLLRTTTLSGTLVHASGAPIARGWVAAKPVDPAPDFEGNEPRVRCYDGHFELRGVLPGVQEVTFGETEIGPTGALRVTAPASDVVLSLSDGPLLRVDVEGGRPLAAPGMVVRWCPWNGTVPMLRSDYAVRAVPGANATVLAGPAAWLRYSLYVYDPERGLAGYRVGMKADDGALTLVLVRASVISGTVRGIPAGRGPYDLFVSIEGVGFGEEIAPDDGGRFRFPGLPPGRYRLVARCKQPREVGLSDASLVADVEAGAGEDVELVLKPRKP